MSKLIGLSLSLCITDIINGKVNKEDVSCIIAATCAKNDADMKKLMDGYSTMYWGKDSERAVEIALELFAENKVYQPRVNGDVHPALNNDDALGVEHLGNHWISSQAFTDAAYAMYEKEGQTATERMGAKYGLPFKWCEPCECMEPIFEQACLTCGSAQESSSRQ